MERQQSAAFVGAAAASPAAAMPKRSVKMEPGDLRGIPVIGPGVGGVSPGTSPESAISRLDRERERRRTLNEEDTGPIEPMVAFG